MLSGPTMVFLAILLLVLTALGIAYVINTQRTERERRELFETVEETSLKLRSLRDYNEHWSFSDCPVERTYNIQFQTRAEAKKTDTKELLATMIHVHYGEIMDATRKAKTQSERYQQYLDRMNSNLFYTPDSFVEETGFDISEYRKVEDFLCREQILNPDTGLVITIKKTYTNEEEGSRSIVKHFKGDVIDKAIHNEWSKRTLFFSDRLARLKALNDAYKKLFVPIRPRFTFQKYCSSIGEFRRYDKNDLLMEEILRQSAEAFREDFYGINENKRLYDQYLKKFASVGATPLQNVNISGVPEKVFYSIEQEAIQKMRLASPTTSFSRSVQVLYYTPQRGNKHEFNRDYPSDRLIELQEEIRKAETHKVQRNEERSKMTNSLRYDVLKRDGFRCVLCGASADDDVKLHVDHIVPVSKGGQTTMENLRTLCNRCNTGKRDKYDPTGPN